MSGFVTTVQRPELLDIVAGWAWNEWFRGRDKPFEFVRDRGASIIAADGFERCFVLLEEGVPVGMASLVHHDLEERPELTPWLAGVYVDPAFRGRGYGVRVVRQVEAAAREAGVGTLWLYTGTAAGLYRRLGWEDHEAIIRPKGPAVIMRRVFGDM